MVDMSLAEIARFGVPPKVETGPLKNQENPQQTYLNIQDALSRQGFRFGGNEPGDAGENEVWLGFISLGDVRETRAIWNTLDAIEEDSIRKGVPIPEGLYDTYEICVDINPQKIPGLIDILGDQFGNIAYTGKVIKPDGFPRDNFPKVVLYIKGADINESLDFAINLAKATKYQLGGSVAHLICAKEIENGSGVFLTQGDFTVKDFAKKQGKLFDYYGIDGALFKETDERYPAYLIRRQNQIGIEEGLYKYVGIEPLSERLVALQEDAFQGIPDTGFWEWKRGIRSFDVQIGKEDRDSYLAPRNEDLPALLENLNKRAEELINDSRFPKDYDYAVRTASLLYTLAILTHPLNNGNGQSCTNLISSLLYEGGYSKRFFRAFLDGRELRARAFKDIQTTEAPTTEFTDETRPIAGRKIKELADKRKQDYSRDFIERATGNLWPKLLEYVQTGNAVDIGERIVGMERVDRAVLRSLMSRVWEIDLYCQKVLSENPTGSRVLSFQEQQRAVEKAQELLRSNHNS